MKVIVRAALWLVVIAALFALNPLLGIIAAGFAAFLAWAKFNALRDELFKAEVAALARTAREDQERRDDEADRPAPESTL